MKNLLIKATATTVGLGVMYYLNGKKFTTTGLLIYIYGVQLTRKL